MHQIFKKSNGLYAIWSTIVDDFIFDDITREDVMNYAIDQTVKEMNIKLENVDRGTAYYGWDFKTYEDACAYRDEVNEDG